MKTQKLTIKINKPVKDVFAFTISPENTPKWVESIAIEKTNEWPPRVGAVYRNQDTTGGWREITLAAFEQDKTFTFDETDGFHIRYTFVAVGADATELECYLWMDQGELQHLFSREVLEKLKQVIEAGDGAIYKTAGSYYEVRISAENIEQAEKILMSLMEKKLTTGGQIIGAPAHFLWKGKVNSMPDYCTIWSYTTSEHKQAVIDEAKRVSVEEVPMVWFMEIDGNQELLDWIETTLA